MSAGGETPTAGDRVPESSDAAEKDGAASQPSPGHSGASIDNGTPRDSTTAPRRTSFGIPTAGGVAVGAPVTQSRQRDEVQGAAVRQTVITAEVILGNNTNKPPRRVSDPLNPNFAANFDAETKENTVRNILNTSSCALIHDETGVVIPSSSERGKPVENVSPQAISFCPSSSSPPAARRYSRSGSPTPRGSEPPPSPSGSTAESLRERAKKVCWPFKKERKDDGEE